MTTKKKKVGLYAPIVNIVLSLIIIGLVFVMLFGHVIIDKFLPAEGAKINLSSFAGFLPLTDEGIANGVMYYVINGRNVEPQAIILLALMFVSIIFVVLNIWRSSLMVPLQVSYWMRDGFWTERLVTQGTAMRFGGYGMSVDEYSKNGFINVPGIGFVWAGRFLKKEPTPKHVERYKKHKGKVDWLIGKIIALRVFTQITAVLVMVLAVGAFGFFVFTYLNIDAGLFESIHSFITSVLSMGIAGAWMTPNVGPMVVFSTYVLIALFGLIAFLISVINR